MLWKKNILRAGGKKYVFQRKIMYCGRVKEHIAVLFKKKMLFIEANGGLVKYPEQDILSLGLIQNGVLLLKKKTNTLFYVSHPYGEMQPLYCEESSFAVVATDARRIALMYEDASIEIFFIDRESQRLRSLLKIYPKQRVKKVILKGRIVVLIYEESIHFILMSKSKTGEWSIKKEKKYVPFSHRVKSILRIASNHGLFLLVNKREIIDEEGLKIDLKRTRQRGKGRREIEKILTKSAIKQIYMQKKGYTVEILRRFFFYESLGYELFGCSLPWRRRISIHSQISKKTDQTQGELLRQIIKHMSTQELFFTAKNIEKHIHLLENIEHAISPIFLEVSQALLPYSHKYSQIALLLAPETKEKLWILDYELLTYSDKYLYRSKNPAYALIREDLLVAKETDRKTNLLQEKKITRTGGGLGNAFTCTLEDIEHIKEIPKRIEDRGIISECKALLSGQRIGDFPFDEYDTENRRKKTFILAVIASIGRGVFLLNRNDPVNIFQVPRMKVFMKKNNNIVCLTSLNDWEKTWPSFHFAVSTTLSIPNRPFISTMHMDGVSSNSLMCLAGSIFGMALRDGLEAKTLLLSERISLARSLILTLSRSCDGILIGATILGNALILLGTGEKKLADVIWFNLRSLGIGGILTMWSALALGVLFMGRNDLFAKEVLIEYMNRKGVIVSQNSGEPTKASYYDKHHRILAGFALSYIYVGEKNHREFIRLPDRTCEIIVNGIMYLGSQLEKVSLLLKEGPMATPLNRFYSALMHVLVMKPTEYEICFDKVLSFSLSLEDAYALAGEIFGYSLLHIPRESMRPDSKFTSQITSLLYSLERRRTLHTILFDYTLLGCCLVLNSTGDPKILGACKRALLSLQNIIYLTPIMDYIPCSGEYREQYGMRYGRIQHIKMALSLLAPACGDMRVDPTPKSIAFIISSFYPEYPLTPEDQDAFQIIRHMYTMSLTKIKEQKEKSEKDKIPLLSEFLKESLGGLSRANTKISLDIICSRFENYAPKHLPRNAIEAAIEDLYNSIV
ncbi:hypothetical protein NEFER03_0034 [Nematocida sp. LUAm3]|nr:hypothetical protein NEFER03_0034 [Nematocida sp. LUAm3]KAI5176250.1 hypothetical protein NEFER02_2047 [Nematocida sp. LUAm2]KAI5176708.1 hypothetical protein NEFER01_0033 [Nematocida sp. LUAm1]